MGGLFNCDSILRIKYLRQNEKSDLVGMGEQLLLVVKEM